MFSDEPICPPKTKAPQMTRDIDRIAQELQESILQGYSQEFKDEFLHPQNIGKLDNADSYVSVTGVCGDTIEIWLAVKDGRITDIRFMTDGCGATITCASYVTRTAKGKPFVEVLQMKSEDVDRYFKGLPEDHKHCAKLAVTTLHAAIDDYQDKSA